MGKTTTTPAPITPSGFAATRPIGAAARGQKRAKFGERSKPFLLAAHPSSIELVTTSEGWRIVPTLKRLVVEPGVNYTPQPKKKGEVPTHAHIEANARAKWDFEVLTNQDEYLVEVEGDPSPGIFTKWERVRTYPDGKWSVDHDNDGYDLWRWELVSSGRIEIREDAVQALRRAIRRQKDRASRTPHLAAAQRADAEADRRAAGLEEALKALEGIGQRVAS